MKLVERLRRMLGRLRDRLRRVPEPPRRFAEEASLFALERPGATREEWRLFAARLAERAYGQGFARGYERRRAPKPRPAEDQEELEFLRHGWSLAARVPRLGEAVAEGDPDAELNAIRDERLRAEAFEREGIERGGWGVVHVRGDERLPRLALGPKKGD